MSRGRPPTHCREALLEIGNSLFQLHGYHGTSLSMILEACAVSRGSFYNYFNGKEAFAIEVIEHYQVLELDLWKAEYGQLEGRHADKLQTMMRRLTEEFSMTNERLGCLLANLSGEMALASDSFRAAIRNAISRVLSVITDDMRLCQDEGSVRTDLAPEQLSRLIWDYWQGALLRMKTENSREPLYQALDMLWQHLLPPQSPLSPTKSEA
ncbi:MAG: TetR family transcriptional regulator [Oceanospirillales bacterium]|uniref:TetR family transcriptional regulator n=1 Tax=Marinobacterium halophilum TaxID=267374 RepID=A0A2P8F0J2_9GAMM|nr:TetR/AcrR family transcriptional regulator [Marinobacterium halophilum]MBR9827380.1 TetR family transcriptional regulator [Oceanospirillales bacterium]PSL15242.1 TetR family transcriptional regulator [Marinobacterium halophilum]